MRLDCPSLMMREAHGKHNEDRRRQPGRELEPREKFQRSCRKSPGAVVVLLEVRHRSASDAALVC